MTSQEEKAGYAIDGLERAWRRATLSDAYTEAVRRCIDDAWFQFGCGDYAAAQEYVSRGWIEMEAGQ